MTFIAPAQTVEARLAPAFFGRRAAKPRGRLLIGGEDGARRALGDDHGLPSAALAGVSIEHLARIALG